MATFLDYLASKSTPDGVDEVMIIDKSSPGAGGGFKERRATLASLSAAVATGIIDGRDGQVLGDSAGEIVWPIKEGILPTSLGALAAYYNYESYNDSTGVWTDLVDGNNFECLNANLPTIDGKFVDFSAGDTRLAGDSVANSYDETLINSKNFSFVMLCRHNAGQVGPRVILTSATEQQTGFRALATGSIQSQATGVGDGSQTLRMGSSEPTAFYVEVTNTGTHMTVAIRASDGTVDSYTTSTAGLPTFNRIGIGVDLRDGSATPNFGQGGISELAMFDRPLTRDEAVAVMNNMVLRYYGTSTRKQIDVFLCAGGQEMEGGSAGALSAEAEDAEILFRNADADDWTVEDGLRGEDTSSDWGLEVGLARSAYADAAESTGREVGIFKFSPTTSIAADHWDPVGGNGTTDRFIGRAIQFINVLVALGYQPVLRGLAWSQGVTDAASMSDSNAYLANVRRVISRIRDGLGAPTLPVVIVVTKDQGATYIDTVRAAQANLGANLTRSASVSGDDLTIAAGAKWDAAGQLAVGQRIYLKFKLPSSSWLGGMTFEERVQIAIDEAALTGNTVTIPPGDYTLDAATQVTLKSRVSISAYGCRFQCPTTMAAGEHFSKFVTDGAGLTDFEWRGGHFTGQVFDPDRDGDWTTNTVAPSAYFGIIEIEDDSGDSARLGFYDITAYEVPGLVVYVFGRGGTDGNGVPIRVENVTIKGCDFDRCGQFFQDRYFNYHLALWPDEFPSSYAGLYEECIDPNNDYGELTFNSGTNTVSRAGTNTLTNGRQIMMGGSGTLPAEFTKGKIYFIRDVSGSSFALAATSGGAAITFATNGTGTKVGVASYAEFSPYQAHGDDHNGAWSLRRCRNVRVSSTNWSSMGDGHRVTQCEGVRISDFSVGPTRMGALFLSTGNTDVLISNGQINGGNGSRLISVETDNDRVRIENLYGYNGGRGIWLNEAREVAVRNCQFENICQKAGDEDDAAGFPKWRRTALQDGGVEIFDDLYATGMRGSHTIENVTMRQTSGNRHMMSFDMSSPRRLIIRGNISNTGSAEAHITGTPSTLVEGDNINLTIIDD